MGRSPLRGGISREENDGEQPLLLPTEVPATHESGRMSGAPCVTDAHASDLTTVTRFVQFNLHYFVSFNVSQLWFLWQHPRVNHLHTFRVNCFLVHITSHLTQHLWVERSSSKPYPPSLVHPRHFPSSAVLIRRIPHLTSISWRNGGLFLL